MKADTVEVLTTKGQFPTAQALVVTEAIDMAIRDAELVTVPVLDARLQAVDAKMERLFAEAKANLDRLSIEVHGKIDRLSTEVNGKIDRLSIELNAKIDRLSFETNAELDRRFTEMDHKLERIRTQLIIAILVGYGAMGPLGNAALEALKRAF